MNAERFYETYELWSKRHTLTIDGIPFPPVRLPNGLIVCATGGWAKEGYSGVQTFEPSPVEVESLTAQRDYYRERIERCQFDFARAENMAEAFSYAAQRSGEPALRPGTTARATSLQRINDLCVRELTRIEARLAELSPDVSEQSASSCITI